MSAEAKEQWRRVSALLDQALELPREKRVAFVLEKSKSDPVTREEVLGLLRASEHAPAYLDEQAVGLVPVEVLESLAMQAEPEDESGSMIGPYRLARLIGRGGMGAVYAAERRDGQFDQQVALKLLPMYGGNTIRERLVAERQLLASLSHPSIARLLDGGVSEDGRPYFVMEYVEGQPIDEFCLDPGISIEERLELVIAVCEAVHAAHQNLIVHRDLKPSNILVIDFRTSGDVRVKLLDFGIAKVLGQSDSESDASLRTRTGDRWMTPSCAAPEQVTGQPTTTATDVYQLGVLLYEVLTGVRPFNESDSGPFERQRAICEEAPTPPSITTRRRPKEITTSRGAIPSGVIRGDLDAIVLRALRKDPAARYSSAEALAEDLRRFLRKEPVLARQGNTRYRLQRFVSRHRIPVSVTAVAIAMVIASSLVYAHNLSVARSEAEAAARAAAVEAENRAEIANFLISVFTEANPSRLESQVETVDEVLERAADQVMSSVIEGDSRQLEFLRVIGEVQIERGEYDAAAQILSEAQRRLDGLDRPLELARVHQTLAHLFRNQRRFDDAMPLIREALPILRTEMGNTAPDTLKGEILYAEILTGVGRYSEADSLLHHVMRAIDNAPNRQRLLDYALGSLGILRRAQGRYADAASAYRELIALLEARGEGAHARAAVTWNNLGFALRRQEDWVGAESAYRRARTIVEDIYGEDHPNHLITLSNLASVYSGQGQHDKLHAVLDQRLALTRRTFDDSHWQVGDASAALARAYVDAGNATAAVPLLRETVEIWTGTLGADHVWTKTGYTLLATALQISGEVDEAREARLASLAVEEAPRLDDTTRRMIDWAAKTYGAHGHQALAESCRDLLDVATQDESD